MKYRWTVLWSDGSRDTCVYAVERNLAEYGANKCIKSRMMYTLGEEPPKPVEIQFIPEKG